MRNLRNVPRCGYSNKFSDCANVECYRKDFAKSSLQFTIQVYRLILIYNCYALQFDIVYSNKGTVIKLSFQINEH